MKRLVLLIAAALLSGAAVSAQNQQAPGISPASPPAPPAAPPVISAEAPAPQTAAAPPPAAKVEKPAKKKAAPAPVVKLEGWTKWPGVEKTPAGNEVLLPFATHKKKVTLIYQKELTKGEPQPPKGYYWRRPKAPWYLAVNHDLELRAIAQARQDQLAREQQNTAKR